MDPNKFLDAKVNRSNGKGTTQLYNKRKKIPLHSTSKTPVRYYRNAIAVELHRTKKVVCSFSIGIKHVVNKYTAGGFFTRFIRSVIDNFNNGQDHLILDQ